MIKENKMKKRLNILLDLIKSYENGIDLKKLISMCAFNYGYSVRLTKEYLEILEYGDLIKNWNDLVVFIEKE